VGIVAATRSAQSNLPRPWDKFRIEVRRKGCHYVYTEFAEPPRHHGYRFFTLNQNGVVVDVTEGFSDPQSNTLKCPGKVLTEAEVSEIVRSARKTRTDLPAPGYPPKHITFHVDGFGEIVEVFANRGPRVE